MKKEKKKINCNNHLVIWVLYHYYSITIFLASFKLDFLYIDKEILICSVLQMTVSAPNLTAISLVIVDI